MSESENRRAVETPQRDGAGAGKPEDHAAAARHQLLVVLAFAAIYLIWGSTYLAIRIAVESIPPFLLAGTRNLLAGAILFALLRARGVAAPTGSEWRHAAAAGVLMLGVGNGLVTWAEQTVPSNLAALLVAAVPIYTALLDWARPGGLRPQRAVMVGITVGFAGMLLLVLPEHGALATPRGLGVVAVLVSALGWTLGSLRARYGRGHPHSVMASAQTMLSGGAALFLVALVRGEPARLSVAALTAPSALAFTYLVLIGSLVAFSAFGWLVTRTSPALMSTTAYVNPVVAVILGWLLLDERLSARALAGAMLIIAAVITMTLGPGSLGRARRWVRARRV